MSETRKIEFTDGAGYEEYMGVWSRSVGDAFLDWLAPAPGLRWLDIGCGNGAFTQAIVDRAAPASVAGIDPSDAQISYAKKRFAANADNFRIGDAMALPFPDDAFDAAVMPLVIFFVPNPQTGVNEMARVVRSGGLVTAYGWDLTGGGFPYAVVQEAMEALGEPKREPPSPDAAELPKLRAFWTAAGLADVETREITVRRTFASVAEFWSVCRKGPNLGPIFAAMPRERLAALEARVNPLLAPDADGRVTLSGCAHAVRGRVR